MSSSSALIVALAAALVRLARLEARAEWQANIASASDAAGYYACIENGMAFGSLEGDAGVGTHGGSEDHVAIVCGRADTPRRGRSCRRCTSPTSACRMTGDS